MKRDVILSILGQQHYADQEPERIELVTDGTMEFRDGGWDICYEESELTGLSGATTTFRVEKDNVTLTRSGTLNSQMLFRTGQTHECLYQLDFGALMMRITATRVFYDIVPDGGVIDLVYEIEIENSEAGVVDYHLEIRAKQ